MAVFVALGRTAHSSKLLLDAVSFVNASRHFTIVQEIEWKGECYAREMEPELAVMARAALESALKEVVPDKAFTHPRSNRVGMNERIEKVMSLGLLTDGVYKAARDLNERGSTQCMRWS